MSTADAETRILAFLAVWFAAGAGIGIYAWWVDGRARPIRVGRLWWWRRVIIAYDIAASLISVVLAAAFISGLRRGLILELAATVFGMGIFGFSALLWRIYLPFAGRGLPRQEYVALAARYFGSTLAISLAGFLVIFIPGAAGAGP